MMITNNRQLVVIDDSMDDVVRVTGIAAGFDRWDDQRKTSTPATGSSGEGDRGLRSVPNPADDVFSTPNDDFGDDDEFDVPSFLK